MHFFSKPFLVVALIIAPILAAPVLLYAPTTQHNNDQKHVASHVHGGHKHSRNSRSQRGRELRVRDSMELEGREPGARTARFKKLGHQAGKFLNHANNAASIIDAGKGVWDMFRRPREFIEANDNLDARDPRMVWNGQAMRTGMRRVGRRVLKHVAGMVFGQTGRKGFVRRANEQSKVTRRDLSDSGSNSMLEIRGNAKNFGREYPSALEDLN
ncbi:hypothetical protein DFP72DRAFT_1069129 [Ephemerocybe angulata]|uniref:Uncharacterized protein n=1 Tax=Ephemerocybe angulata TaxID=980116 RepID=A0A8H6M380_9AGAR|nr:hypothetical protein DFP72DRAFT_1069129 [Tulosesus angulatus]